MQCRTALLSFVFASSAAGAQETSRDRYELDIVAGRALFQTSPLAYSIVDDRPALPVPTPVAAVAADPNPRRRIRVVYPGPYGR